MGFSSSHVWMWELDHKESWALKNWCFQTAVLEDLMLLNCGAGRLLKVPWTARRSNQSILKEINPEFSLEGLMLKLQHSGHLMHRANSLEKTLMLGKTEDRRRGWQSMRWLHGIIDPMDRNLRNWEILKDREVWGAAVHGFGKNQMI